MNLPARNTPQKFTWTDYRNWPNEERWELIGGEAFAMSLTPTTKHQQVVGRFYSRLEQQLTGKSCQAFISPIDVRLSENDVVQPDVLIVCQADKIKPSHTDGVPDVVFEVLSPSTATRDLRDKKALYEQFGIGEYIVVAPEENYAIRFLRCADGLYDKGTVFGSNETLIIQTLSDMPIALWEVFGQPKPESDQNSS